MYLRLARDQQNHLAGPWLLAHPPNYSGVFAEGSSCEAAQVPKSTSFSGVLSEIGQSLRRARQRAALSQEEVAALAGIGCKRYQELEGGRVNMTVRTLHRVADALGLDFWDLVRPLSEPTKAGRSR